MVLGKYNRHSWLMKPSVPVDLFQFGSGWSVFEIVFEVRDEIIRCDGAILEVGDVRLEERIKFT